MSHLGALARRLLSFGAVVAILMEDCYMGGGRQAGKGEGEGGIGQGADFGSNLSHAPLMHLRCWQFAEILPKSKGKRICRIKFQIDSLVGAVSQETLYKSQGADPQTKPT